MLESFNAVEDAQRVVEDFETTVERMDEKVDTTVEEKEQIEATVESLTRNVEEQYTQIERKREALREAEAYYERVSEQKNLIETAKKKHERIADLSRDIDSLQTDIKYTRKRRQDASERVNELKNELDEVKEKLRGTDIDDLREEKNQMDKNITRLNSLIEELEGDVREFDRERTEISGELEQIADLRDRIGQVEEREEWASNLYGEFQQIRATYEEVKANLRKQNIALLRKYVNDLFDEFYQNENYDKIEIGENYEMQLVRSTGEHMSPRLTSGGEGAILNLALRAAIYRLVAEKEARAGQLPPFILDEPTDGLDTTHVRELSELIEVIRQWDVPQVFLVSHEEELLDAAENEILVEMDHTSEASQTEVRVGSGAALTAAEGDD